MRLFRVLPFLSLLLGARSSSRVPDSGERARHQVEARQIGTNLCVPIGVGATIVELLPVGFAYLTRGDTAAASGESTFSFLSLWLSVPVFINNY